MNYANSARNRVVLVLIPLVSITLLFPSGRVQASLSPSIGATTLCPSAQSGRVIIGPAAANMARVLLADRRMSRGRRFLNNRSLDLDLEDTVVILGNHGERLVFVPFTDGRGEREAYLLHRSKGNKNKVTLFVLYIRKSRQAHTNTGQATISKVSFRQPQDEMLVIEEVVVEEAYVINEWEEIVYDEYETNKIKEQMKCIVLGCAMSAACGFAGPGILKCIAVICVGAGIYCTLKELTGW